MVFNNFFFLFFTNFCFTKQTVNALIWTLWSQALLFTELLDIDKYEYVFPRRLQSDPIENRFSQCRQMSRGRFLVSLMEVNISERILVCRSILKAGINIWEDEEEGAREEQQEDFLQASATWRWNYKSVFVWKCTWCSGSSCWFCSDKIALPIPLWKLRRYDGPTREKWQHKQIFRCSFTWRVNCALMQSYGICLQLLRYFRFCRNCN